MRALHRKMLRDLWQLRGQALAIALVIASGVATYVMFLVTLDSLQLTRDTFYRDYRFPQVFSSLTRAPESLRARIAALPGVDKVDTRVVAPVTIDVAGFNEPVTGVITSVPDHGEPWLNKLYLRTGRGVDGARDDEVVVSEAFASAHGFVLGDSLHVTIKGHRKRLVIVGTAVSPEYINQLRPGGVFPDFKRYGVMWMARTPLAAAYDMDGAFNNVVLGLRNGGDALTVIDHLDQLLLPYGGVGAYPREDQISHRFLHEEFRQLENMSGMFPAIFLAVAAFLLNVVVTRLVATQREQVAALKAFGYGNGAITLHYVGLVMLIVLLGAALGVALGVWMGEQLSGIYSHFFRLPYLIFQVHPAVVAQAVFISAVSALLGIVFAVRRAARLKPAEAMRPEAPALYRQSWLERLGLRRWLSQPARMILRHLSRRPLKSLLSVLGIAFAAAIMMTGRFQGDTVGFMLHVQYQLSQRDDLSVNFVEPTSYRALYNLRALHGVEAVEVFRSVPVRLRAGHRSYRTGIQGLESGGEIKRVLDTALRPVNLPAEGLVLSGYLGELLRVKPGDMLTVEVLEGARPVRLVPVVAMVEQFIGVSAYMDLAALNRLMREAPTISGAYMLVDEPFRVEVYQRLKAMPRIMGTVVREQEIKNFHKTMNETMLFFTWVATLFAGVIAFGVVYNSARITLTERARELASLRVLGLTRGEISYILLGELALLTLAAIPLGLWLGRGLCAYIARTAQTDLYRVPLILEPATYAFAAVVVLLSALVSGLLVRRRLDELDLIAVLKTKE